jgi:uncharacterized protein YuzE
MAGMKVWYDREGDLLEVIFEDAPSSMVEIIDDVFERRTSDGRITGILVMNFSHHDRDGLTLPLAITAVASHA